MHLNGIAKRITALALGANSILTRGFGNLDPEVAKATIDVMYNGNMYIGEPDGVSAGGILYKFNVKTGET